MQSYFRPAVVISLAFVWIQLLLAKYVFLIDKDATLALDNRYGKNILIALGYCAGFKL